MTRPGTPFAKGHGTGNDFVILTDLDGGLGLGPDDVQRLCDRHQGVGADGVLVVTRTAARAEVAAQSAEYFMDYRNADGSVAQMCGNGARVFVRFLLEEGLAAPGEFDIATRGGQRRVRTDGDAIRVDMGPATLLDVPELRVTPQPITLGVQRPAVGVLMPNPHAVCWVDSVAEAGPLLERPLVTPVSAFPDGVNVEFVVERAADHIQMRVHERGVGETQSCGTGACAAAVATLARRGEQPAGQEVRVDVSGGTVRVVWCADGEVQLIGPAVIVARGIVEERWWNQA